MLNIKCFFEFQSFDYSSIFSYEVPKDEVKFKSVFKFEELSRKNYEADYYKVSRVIQLNLSPQMKNCETVSHTFVTVTKFFMSNIKGQLIHYLALSLSIRN